MCVINRSGSVASRARRGSSFVPLSAFKAFGSLGGWTYSELMVRGKESVFRKAGNVNSPFVEAVLELSPAGVVVSSLSFHIPMSLTRAAVRERLAGLLDASSSLSDDII